MMSAQKEQQLAAALARLPRVKLASVLPTPLEELPRFGAAIGGPPVYIKRDDLTGLGYGGNKTRMLEFSLADALRHDADVIVTGAGVQSNYCRQMAAACARLGLELHLLLRPIREVDHHQVQGNHLLQRLFGAKCTILPDGDPGKQGQAILARMDELRKQGRRPYWPRQADTVDIDALAYAESALEVVQQSRAQGISPSHLYLAALDTTQSGVVLGLKFVESPIQVRGFSPFEKWPQRFENMARIANQGAARLGLKIEFKAGDFDNEDNQVGERYGIPTPQGLEALRLLARTEGILLDPVYTSKAVAGLIADVRAGKLAKDRPVVFLHTGGSPAIFGYAAEVLGA
jgi:1-aminocyclopropane-1-carboxylate deaminase/D-cysteine desulfhydrase-like pyridoxal-dependent ACC family enzyme